MPKFEVESRASSKAPREKVWEVLEDVPRWAEWGPWNSTELERGRCHRGRLAAVCEA